MVDTGEHSQRWSLASLLQVFIMCLTRPTVGLSACLRARENLWSVFRGRSRTKQVCQWWLRLVQVFQKKPYVEFIILNLCQFCSCLTWFLAKHALAFLMVIVNKSLTSSVLIQVGFAMQRRPMGTLSFHTSAPLAPRSRWWALWWKDTLQSSRYKNTWTHDSLFIGNHADVEIKKNWG